MRIVYSFQKSATSFIKLVFHHYIIILTLQFIQKSHKNGHQATNEIMYNVLSDQHNLVYEFRDESALFATTDANFCEKNTLYIGVMNLGMKFVMISKIVFVHSPLFILLTRKWPHVLHDIWQNYELSSMKTRDESEICLQNVSHC